MPNPWEEFAQHHKKGDKVGGQIKSITDFGVFIGLPGGIDGLVHLSDLSWSRPGEEAVRNYKKGDEIEAMVLAIDVERERISLGIKQLAGDPFTNFVAGHEKGAIVKGTVKSIDAKGAVIDLGRRRRRLSARVRSLARSRRRRTHSSEGRRRGQRDDHQHRPQEPHHQPVDQGEGQRRNRGDDGAHAVRSPNGHDEPGSTAQGEAGQQVSCRRAGAGAPVYD